MDLSSQISKMLFLFYFWAVVAMELENNGLVGDASLLCQWWTFYPYLNYSHVHQTLKEDLEAKRESKW